MADKEKNAGQEAAVNPAKTKKAIRKRRASSPALPAGSTT